ncbi:hypothetical protein SNE510_70870 [Streptomyces sp. NE5-10]|nr:hypothetical protein SNE510_70870 [Streptomyces sp. NE5-10]
MDVGVEDHGEAGPFIGCGGGEARFGGGVAVRLLLRADRKGGDGVLAEAFGAELETYPVTVVQDGARRVLRAPRAGPGSRRVAPPSPPASSDPADRRPVRKRAGEEHVRARSRDPPHDGARRWRAGP